VVSALFLPRKLVTYFTLTSASTEMMTATPYDYHPISQAKFRADPLKYVALHMEQRTQTDRQTDRHNTHSVLYIST